MLRAEVARLQVELAAKDQIIQQTTGIAAATLAVPAASTATPPSPVDTSNVLLEVAADEAAPAPDTAPAPAPAPHGPTQRTRSLLVRYQTHRLASKLREHPHPHPHPHPTLLTAFTYFQPNPFHVPRVPHHAHGYTRLILIQLKANNRQKCHLSIMFW